MEFCITLSEARNSLAARVSFLPCCLSRASRAAGSFASKLAREVDGWVGVDAAQPGFEGGGAHTDFAGRGGHVSLVALEQCAELLGLVAQQVLCSLALRCSAFPEFGFGQFRLKGEGHGGVLLRGLLGGFCGPSRCA